MTTTLRDVFTGRANEIGPADLDLDALIGLGEHRLRRRRIIATVGAAAAVLLVVGIGVGGAVLNHSADSEPTNHPKNDQPPPSHPAERPLVYTDDTGGHPLKGGTVEIQVGAVHVGDRTVNLGQVSYYVRGWALRVTDDGIVYVQGDDSSVWFSDGGRPQQIAERNCFNPDHFGGIATASTGSYAAWFDCTSASRGDLVVYDTAAGDEVARTNIASCRPLRTSCHPDAVVGDHVYFRSRVYDLGTGQVTDSTPQQQANDLRTQPRTLVVGNSWQTGTAQTDVSFYEVGSHLVPIGADGRPARAFDSATGQPVRLRLPDGLAPISRSAHPDAPSRRVVFEWLDDDTIALIPSYPDAGPATGDIITCRLSTGDCELAVKAAPDDVVRLVPGASFPG